MSLVAAELRWFRLMLLPALALALWDLDDKVQSFVWHIAAKPEVGELVLAGQLLGCLLGPIITASLFAYPIARLYPQNAKAVSLLATLPTVLSGLSFLLDAPVDSAFLYIVQLIWLCIFMPVAASLVHRELAGSQLLVAKLPARIESPGTGSGQAALPAPRWLLLYLLPILAVALLIAHGWLQFRAFDVAFIVRAREFQLPLLILAAVVAPALTASAFAYPIARSYGRHSAMAGLVICAPASLYWTFVHLPEVQLPWTVAAYTIVVVSLLVFFPLAAEIVRRRLGDSRLVVVNCQLDDNKAATFGGAGSVPG